MYFILFGDGMNKLLDKQHIIGVDGTEDKVKKIVEDLSRNFANVTSEIVPYKWFANRETRVELWTSVREVYAHIKDDLFGKYSQGLAFGNKLVKFNDRLIQSLLIREAAINHGAKWLNINQIPQYNILRRPARISSDILPVRDDDVSSLVKYFEDKRRMAPIQQQQLHLIGTQDTADFVASAYEYLATNLWYGAVSSEISTYKESSQGITQVDLSSPVQNKHVYVIGDVNWSKMVEWFDVGYNDRLMQMILAAHNADKYNAKTVNFVPLCFPYSRQDKPTQWGMKERVSREPSSAQFMVDIIQNFLWVDNCLTMDIHNPAVINNSSETKFVNLYTGWMIQQVAHILEQEWKDALKLSAMDEWGLNKLRSISKDLQLDHLIVLKTRNYSQINTVDAIFAHGDVKGKDILIHDDMLDTGGSLVKLIEALHALGARSINVVITHWMFNGDAILKLKKLHDIPLFENIYISNTVYRDKEFYPDFVKVIDASKNFADPIKSIYLGQSINYNYWVTPATTQ